MLHHFACICMLKPPCVCKPEPLDTYRLKPLCLPKCFCSSSTRQNVKPQQSITCVATTAASTAIETACEWSWTQFCLIPAPALLEGGSAPASCLCYSLLPSLCLLIEALQVLPDNVEIHVDKQAECTLMTCSTSARTAAFPIPVCCNNNSHVTVQVQSTTIKAAQEFLDALGHEVIVRHPDHTKYADVYVYIGLELRCLRILMTVKYLSRAVCHHSRTQLQRFTRATVPHGTGDSQVLQQSSMSSQQDSVAMVHESNGA